MGAGVASEHSEQSENWNPPGSRRRISAIQRHWTSVLVRVRRWVLRLGGMRTGHCSSLHRAARSYPARAAPACALPHCGAAVLRPARRGPPNKSHKNENRRMSLSEATSLLGRRCGQVSLSSLADRTPGLPQQPWPLATDDPPGRCSLRRRGRRRAQGFARARCPSHLWGGTCVMASCGGDLGGGKSRRKNGGAGGTPWRGRVRGSGLCPCPHQGLRQRRPLRAAVVRAWVLNDGCPGRVGGRAAGLVPGEPCGGSSSPRWRPGGYYLERARDVGR